MDVHIVSDFFKQGSNSQLYLFAQKYNKKI